MYSTDYPSCRIVYRDLGITDLNDINFNLKDELVKKKVLALSQKFNSHCKNITKVMVTFF